MALGSELEARQLEVTDRVSVSRAPRAPAATFCPSPEGKGLQGITDSTKCHPANSLGMQMCSPKWRQAQTRNQRGTQEPGEGRLAHCGTLVCPKPPCGSYQEYSEIRLEPNFLT